MFLECNHFESIDSFLTVSYSELNLYEHVFVTDLIVRQGTPRLIVNKKNKKVHQKRLVHKREAIFC
jgi:hypothetical protein